MTEPITDKATVAAVQSDLRALGYVDVGKVDGDLVPKGKTEAAILDVRNALDLPLKPVIDDQLLEALKTAPKKMISPEQAMATAVVIAPKIEAVAATTSVVRKSWWGKFTAWFFGIPSTLVLVVGQFDQAIPLVSSARGLFSEVPWQVWAIMFIGLCVVFATQAHMTSNSGQKAEDALVKGYQEGTVKPDKEVTS